MNIKEDIFDIEVNDKVISDNLKVIENGKALTVPLKVLNANPNFKLAFDKKFGPLEDF